MAPLLRRRGRRRRRQGWLFFGNRILKTDVIPKNNHPLATLVPLLRRRGVNTPIKDFYFNISGTDRVAQYAAPRKSQIAEADKITDSIWKEIDRVQKQRRDKVDFGPFLGTYHDNWFGDLVISVKNSKLWFESKRSPKLAGELFPYSGNSFVVKWRDRSLDADAYVNFALNKQGKAMAITMNAVSPLTDFSYDFHDLNFSRLK